MANRDVRVRQLPKRFDGKVWQTEPQPVVRLGDVGSWTMVRHADYRNACPFVISRKEWDKLPAQRIEARSDETPKEVQPEGREPGPKDAPTLSQRLVDDRPSHSGGVE